MSAPSSPGATNPNSPDPRIAAIVSDDGQIDVAAVEALLSRHPRTLTIPEIEAMHVVFFEIQYSDDNPLARVAFTSDWLAAFVAVTGGTITREKVRHGQTVERSVRRERGREDVRRLRSQANGVGRRVDGRAREHRPAGTRRASSSSSTSSQDPGSDSDEPAPRPCKASWCRNFVYGATQKKYCGTDYCNDRRDAERQRQHRIVDLVEFERRRRDEAARLAGYVGEGAFGLAGEHALAFVFPELDEYEALLERACRCNGHHIDGGVVGCLKCGLSREAVAS